MWAFKGRGFAKGVTLQSVISLAIDRPNARLVSGSNDFDVK